MLALHAACHIQTRTNDLVALLAENATKRRLLPTNFAAALTLSAFFSRSCSAKPSAASSPTVSHRPGGGPPSAAVLLRSGTSGSCSNASATLPMKCTATCRQNSRKKVHLPILSDFRAVACQQLSCEYVQGTCFLALKCMPPQAECGWQALCYCAFAAGQVSVGRCQSYPSQQVCSVQSYAYAAAVTDSSMAHLALGW